MKEKKAIYYQDHRGIKPAKNFIDNFEIKTKAKMLARLEYLEKHWHEIGRPLVDKMRIIMSGYCMPTCLRIILYYCMGCKKRLIKYR